MDSLVINELPNTIQLQERDACPISQAIALSSQKAESALNALDMLAPCIWPRLVLARAEIESLRSELRAAREGEERAYEALKRLRTRTQTQTRTSSRARSMTAADETSSAIPSFASTRIQSLDCEVVQVTAGDMTASPAQSLQGEERVFSGPVSPEIIRGVLFKELQEAHERLTAAALREEQLRMELENSRRMLIGYNSRSSVNDGLPRLPHPENEYLRREVAKRDGRIAELRAQLELEQLKSARHRDVAATVQSLFCFSHLNCAYAALSQIVLVAAHFLYLHRKS